MEEIHLRSIRGVGRQILCTPICTLDFRETELRTTEISEIAFGERYVMQNYSRITKLAA
jgi:hypothetical protein